MASGPIISWQIDWETMETEMDFIFLGSKITADGDCNHEIRRYLVPGRKDMTILDSILKSKDITLPTKAHLVKAMVFPVVMYGYESWTIRKAQCWKIYAFKLWCQRRLFMFSFRKATLLKEVKLKVVLHSPPSLMSVASLGPWTSRSNQLILKEVNPEYSLERLMLKLKLKHFGHLMQRPDSLEKTLMLGKTQSGRRRGRQRTG